MPRFKPLDYGQGKFISVQFEHQILPGSLSSGANAWAAGRRRDSISALQSAGSSREEGFSTDSLGRR
jgi:hypothetical protein